MLPSAPTVSAFGAAVMPEPGGGTLVLTTVSVVGLNSPMVWVWSSVNQI
jgi:hypothetical protein